MKKLIYAGFLSVCLFTACKDKDNELNDTDRGFLKEAGHANMAEVDAGQLASERATTDTVRTFGEKMETDHQQAYNELKALGSDVDVSIPDEPDAKHKQIKQQLMELTGRAFDSTYMHLQVEDHQKTITLFENQAKNGKDERVKNYANKYLPHLRMHLQIADSIANSFQ